MDRFLAAMLRYINGALLRPTAGPGAARSSASFYYSLPCCCIADATP
jgi:hypothetical protein